MVADPTPANIAAASKADSRSRSIRMKDLWQTTTFREMMLKRRWSQKQRQALSDRMKALWTDESWRTKWVEKRWTIQRRQEQSDRMHTVRVGAIDRYRQTMPSGTTTEQA